MRKVLEKVLAGLRNMKNKPDILLFCDIENTLTFDKDNISGVPVFHIEGITDHLWKSCLGDNFFTPVWKKEGDHYSDKINFIEGYENFNCEV